MASDVDPLPYLVVFLILFWIFLGTFTWSIRLWYEENQCGYNPNIWCSDDWVCNKSCPNNVSPCFAATGTTGLASCIFGPNAPGATACFNPPPQGGAPACDCPALMQGINNCLSGCPQKLSQPPGPNAGICCCNDPTNIRCTPNAAQCRNAT